MSERTGKHRAYALRGAGSTLGAAALLGLSTARCTFPEYDSIDALAGAAGAVAQSGNGGVAGAAGTGSGLAAAAGIAGAEPSGGGTASGADGGAAAGGAPACSGEQWPVAECPDGCLERYPDDCYDGSRTDVTLGVACGAGCQACTNEACSSDSDCLSGACISDGATSACHAPLVLRMTSHEATPTVGITAWTLTLSSDEPAGGEPFSIQELELRYYFDRNGVIEPIIVRSTQSTLRLVGGVNESLPGTAWTIQRVEESPNVAYDAYVAVTFSDSAQLFPGDQLLIYQQMSTGDTGKSAFDQRSNYSFANVQDEPWLGVSVFYRGQLLWGLEPRPSNPRACFVRGIDLAGQSTTVEGRPWMGSVEAGVVSGGTSVSQAGPWFPPPAPSSESMLTSAEHLEQGQELSVPVENGSYLVYVHAVSTSTEGAASVFTVQGQAYPNGTRFRAQSSDGGFAWSRLGPFRVEVSGGVLTLATSMGSMNFAGLELWYPE